METERQRDTDTATQTHTQRHTHRNRQTHRERESHTQREAMDIDRMSKYLQLSPCQPAGCGNGVSSVAREIFPVYRPAAALSAVPLSALKQEQRFSGSRAAGGTSQHLIERDGERISETERQTERETDRQKERAPRVPVADGHLHVGLAAAQDLAPAERATQTHTHTHTHTHTQAPAAGQISSV
jgi:hypothetical protein